MIKSVEWRESSKDYRVFPLNSGRDQCGESGRDHPERHVISLYSPAVARKRQPAPISRTGQSEMIFNR
jgi:hypothetical protein